MSRCTTRSTLTGNEPEELASTMAGKKSIVKGSHEERCHSRQETT